MFDKDNLLVAFVKETNRDPKENKMKRVSKNETDFARRNE
jgi:hypothetical protein